MRGPKRLFPSVGALWMLTFADLVTLLLALFVMIFSMSTLDSAVLLKITDGLRRREISPAIDAGAVPEHIRLAADILGHKENIGEQEDKIKELLFPVENLPPDLDKGTLMRSMRIVPTVDGVLFIIDNARLFTPGSAVPLPGAASALEPLISLMGVLTGEVSLSAHEAPQAGTDPYQTSLRRALAVLGMFLRRGQDGARLGISARGPDSPPSIAGTGAARLEILFKTGQ